MSPLPALREVLTRTILRNMIFLVIMFSVLYAAPKSGLTQGGAGAGGSWTICISGLPIAITRPI